MNMLIGFLLGCAFCVGVAILFSLALFWTGKGAIH
jgi:hypothetical protein